MSTLAVERSRSEPSPTRRSRCRFTADPSADLLLLFLSASSNLVVSSDSLTFDGSTLSIKSYRDTQTDSGNVAVRHFCDNCGTPIRTVVEGKEETSFLKSGEYSRRLG